jgi:hypothetical protein
MMIFQIIEQIANLYFNLYFQKEEELFEVNEMVLLHRRFLSFLLEKVKLLVNHYYDHDKLHSIHKNTNSYMPNTI